MIYASLLLNIVVLVPVTAGLLLNWKEMDVAFGPSSTAREILLCMYLAILAGSGLLLYWKASPVDFFKALLVGQVFYKLLSVLVVKNKRTPVIWFNLAIAIFHLVTLQLI